MYYVIEFEQHSNVFLSIEGPFDNLILARKYGREYCAAYIVYMLNQGNGKMLEIK